MPHSYTSMMVHIVFSTKDRQSLLVPTLEERLYPYFGGIVRDLGGRLLTVNGVEDHVHLLASMAATTSIAEITGKVKGSSSKWIHETFPEQSGFAWQRGYAAFSQRIAGGARRRVHRSSEAPSSEGRIPRRISSPVERTRNLAG
jgi:REP element-mobilizing transposase RayT